MKNAYFTRPTQAQLAPKVLKGDLPVGLLSLEASAFVGYQIQFLMPLLIQIF